MYKIKEIQGYENHLQHLEIESPNKASCAKIFLSLGGSLQELTLKSKTIINDLHPLEYKDTYASSILFPFANRIKNGTYTFEGKEYKFDINQKEENNALHGLVYNKTFKIIDQKTTDAYASIKLIYEENEHSEGFPYTYSIQLHYTLTTDSLNLNVTVKNTDSKAFPFTLGWHPYFSSSDLYNSNLEFDSNKTLVFDSKNITTGIKDISNEKRFDIKDKKLDDCFILNSSQVQFNTPDYKLMIDTSSKDRFLQIYTPNKPNTIAIEPTTGVSDSFNNKMGLNILKPNEVYDIDWSLKLIK